MALSIAAAAIASTPASAYAEDCWWLVDACAFYCDTHCTYGCERFTVYCDYALCEYSCRPPYAGCCPSWCWYNPWCACGGEPLCWGGI